MKKTIADKEVEIDEEGYLVDSSQWNKEVAREIAKNLSIELGDKQWEVIEYLRTQHDEGVEISIRRVGKSGIVDIKEFYGLFPGGPLKNASKIAGLARPASCA